MTQIRMLTMLPLLVIFLFQQCTTYADKPPNIILMVADDLGIADLEDHGAFTIATPNLNTMRKEGVDFTQFYAHPLCSPSRAAMLTGRLPQRSGVFTNMPNHTLPSPPNPPFPLDIFYRVFYPGSAGCMLATETLITQDLKNFDSRYWTGMVGKWHLGHQAVQGCLPTRQGFNSFLGIPYSHEESSPTGLGFVSPTVTFPFPRLPLYHNETIVQQPVDVNDLPGLYRDRILSDLDWLGDTKTPFFYHYAFDQPHYPVFMSPSYASQSLRGKYGDAVEEMDASVGMVLNKIRSNSYLRRNTLVVFLSDNGAWVHPGSGVPGGPVTFPLQGGANGGLRDEKGSTWEGGVRVPAIFWSGKRDDFVARVSTAVASVQDLVPTFLEYVGASVPSGRILDGFSLMPLLIGDNNTSPTTFIYGWRESLLYFIRYGPWKCHYFTRTGFGTDAPLAHNPCLLFNVEWDPFENQALNGSDCFGSSITSCNDVRTVTDAEYTRHVASLSPLPQAQFELLNVTYTPCCHGVVTPGGIAAAQAAGYAPAQDAFWQFLNCTC